MTQRQAWTVMAEAWERARRTDRLGPVVACIGRSKKLNMGLCMTVRRLVEGKRISRRVEVELRKAINRAVARRQSRGYEWSMFAWPTDEAGAKARAAFCRRMAARRSR